MLLCRTDLGPVFAGQRSYGTIGTAPNRQFILRLVDVPYCCTLTPFAGLTVDVVLTETTNSIEIRYYSVPANFRNVDIGIQNNGPTTTDWLAIFNDGVLDGTLAALLTGSTVQFYTAASCAPNCPYTSPVATSSLCLILYSLPGNVDYPFSIATSAIFTYSSAVVSTPQGRAVTILSGSGTRTYTNKFGFSFTTPFVIASAGADNANNLLYIGSSFPFDSRGLTLNLSSPTQLPGAGPQTLSTLINVYNNSGVIFEYGIARVDGLGSAWLSTVPGFVNSTIGPANLNALGPDYGQCSAPISFTNGLRPPIEPNANNGGMRFTYTYFVSDGLTYSVSGSLLFTATSGFATTIDQLGNNYQIVANITGTRTYNYFPTNQQVVSQVMGVSSASFRYADQRFYPYALLVASPGVYTVDAAPFLDQDGVEFAISPPAPATGAAPGTGVQYSAISLYNSAPEPNAVLIDGTYTSLPVFALQHQTYAFLRS